VGLTTLPCKKKTVEKPPRNSVGFCGGGQGLSWAVEPRKEEEEFTTLEGLPVFMKLNSFYLSLCPFFFHIFFLHQISLSFRAKFKNYCN
jgi:hypothetical protein